MKYSSDLIYPKIQVEKENKEYAKLLLNVYSGRNSETTAIFEYIYQSIILDNKYGEILKNIAIVEMKHLNILGKTIKLLGLDPMYIYPNNVDNGFKYWNSSYVDYNNNLTHIISSDINEEKMAIDNYNEIIKKIDDKYVVEIIKRLILDEEIHLKILTNIQNELNFQNFDIDNN